MFETKNSCIGIFTSKIICMALLFTSCAQNSHSATNQIRKDTWRTFVGQLSAGGNKFCNGAYLGDKIAVQSALGLQVDSGKYFLTSLHCVTPYQNNINSLNITWPTAPSSTQVLGLSGAGNMTGNALKDVALLKIDNPPEHINAFNPQLADTNGENNIRPLPPGTGQTYSILGIEADNDFHQCFFVDSLKGGIGALCFYLSTRLAPGLSGSVVVGPRGELTGVFAATGNTDTASYYIAALNSATLGTSAAQISVALDEQAKQQYCKAELSKICLGTASPTPEQVTNFLGTSWDAPNGGLQCTKVWTGKPWAGTQSNGDACGFPNTQDVKVLHDFVGVLLRTDDFSKCVSSSGSSCTKSDDCFLTKLDGSPSDTRCEASPL